MSTRLPLTMLQPVYQSYLEWRPEPLNFYIFTFRWQCSVELLDSYLFSCPFLKSQNQLKSFLKVTYCWNVANAFYKVYSFRISYMHMVYYSSPSSLLQLLLHTLFFCLCHLITQVGGHPLEERQPHRVLKKTDFHSLVAVNGQEHLSQRWGSCALPLYALGLNLIHTLVSLLLQCPFTFHFRDFSLVFGIVLCMFL